MSNNPVPPLDMPSCTMQLLSDMHAGFMNSSTHVCKVLQYQARYLGPELQCLLKFKLDLS